MKPTNPKITWQPYPATRPTEAGDYFVTLECEDKGLGIFTFILPFIPQRGRFFGPRSGMVDFGAAGQPLLHLVDRALGY